jgi:hypothetical protein
MLKISDSVDVRKKAQELGCNIPSQIALLPRNFDIALSKEEFLYESMTPMVRDLLRKNSIPETPLVEPEKEKFIVEKELVWVVPPILFLATVLSQNPYLVTVVLNIISNYLTELFREIPIKLKKEERGIKVRFTAYEETKSGSYKKLEIEGEIKSEDQLDKLKDYAKKIIEIFNDG